MRRIQGTHTRQPGWPQTLLMYLLHALFRCRQTVLNKLAGEHLALAAAAQSPALEPAAAAADLQLR